MENENTKSSNNEEEEINHGAQPITPHPDLHNQNTANQTNTNQNQKNTEASTSSEGRKWYKHPLFFVGIGVFLLLLSAGAYAFYEQQIAPKMAVKKFVETHTSDDLESMSYTGNISFESEQENEFTGTVDFSGAVDQREDNELFSMDIDGEYGAQGMNLEVKAQSVIEDDTLYFKVDQPQIVEAFVPGVTGNWFKTDISETLEEASGCKEAEVNSVLESIMEKMEEDSPFVNTSRVGWGFETVQDTRTSHYKGEIDMEKLIKAVEAAEEEVADTEGCEDFETTNYDNYDYDEYEVSYDVWLGSGLNKLELQINNDEVVTHVTLTTTEYNQDVDIDVPSDAQDFEAAMKAMYQNQAQTSSDTEVQQLTPEFEETSEELPSKTTLGDDMDTNNQTVLLRSIFNFFN